MLTFSERERLRRLVDKHQRKRLRMAYPGQPRPYCQGMTEMHTKCRNQAQPGRLYCGRHGNDTL